MPDAPTARSDLFTAIVEALDASAEPSYGLVMTALHRLRFTGSLTVHFLNGIPHAVEEVQTRTLRLSRPPRRDPRLTT